VELFRTPSATGASALLPDWLPARVPRQQMGYALGFEGDFGQPRPSGRFGPTHESFGHLGAGGQLGFADPVRGVSVGFLRNHMADWSVSDALVQSLYDCL
jgi:CubicO group peptidase (beta-lactamase class C family)